MTAGQMKTMVNQLGTRQDTSELQDRLYVHIFKVKVLVALKGPQFSDTIQIQSTYQNKKTLQHQIEIQLFQVNNQDKSNILDLTSLCTDGVRSGQLASLRVGGVDSLI